MELARGQLQKAEEKRKAPGPIQQKVLGQTFLYALGDRMLQIHPYEFNSWSNDVVASVVNV